MKNLIIIFLAIASVMAIARLLSERQIANLRARGVYPEKGKEKEGDVLRLLELGKPTLAIRCYRSLHKIGLREAREHVLSLYEK
jgi:ribosomal protein L7/L12